MSQMDERKLDEFRRRLQDRAVALRQELQQTVQRSDDEKSELLRDHVRDPGDDSFLDLVTDVNLADVERDLGEFRAVSAALTRIENGEFGTCEDCGRDIDVKRLEVQPFASRCIQCQERHEHLTNEGRAPTL